MEKLKVLFLDRDGVINEDFGYVHRVEDFKFRPGIFGLCRFFAERGFSIIVITNQSGIARGIFTEEDFARLTVYMVGEFKKNGIDILDVLHCPDKDDTPMRKPNPGMFLRAISKYGIDVDKSVNIGDKRRDLEAGFKAGIANNLYIDDAL